MSIKLGLENKVENKVENNINYNRKDLNYYSKAIPYVIEKAIFNAPKEVGEELRGLFNPKKIALLVSISVLGLSNPIAPAVAAALTGAGVASLINNVANARSSKDLDKAAGLLVGLHGNKPK